MHPARVPRCAATSVPSARCTLSSSSEQPHAFRNGSPCSAGGARPVASVGEHQWKSAEPAGTCGNLQ
eukprot:8603107-Alexandrium_andersonii.AAC.1